MQKQLGKEPRSILIERADRVAHIDAGQLTDINEQYALASINT